MPSEASVKFFDETFFQKSFDLALDLSGRAAQERKLGKQPGNLWLPAPFPDGSAVALSVTAAAVPALPKGEPSLASPFGGRWCPVGTVQRLVSAAASVGDGRSPLGCITRAGRRECPRRGRRGQPAPAAHVRYSLDEHERQRAAIGANREPRHWAPRAEDGKMSTLSKKPGFMRVL